MTEFLNWHDMMIISEMRNYKNYDVEYIKKKVTYVDDCNVEAENKVHIEMFWKVYTEFNYEDKKALFNKWMGRSRTYWEKHTLKKVEFRIKLDPEIMDKIPKSRPD